MQVISGKGSKATLVVQGSCVNSEDCSHGTARKEGRLVPQPLGQSR